MLSIPYLCKNSCDVLSFQYFRRLLHQLNDGKMLRTDALTLTAADTIRRLAAAPDQAGIKVL